MSLPAEILDNILSFLQSDTATLTACSRSHPILSQLVERYLYANITVQDTPKALRGVLHLRPYVANYVRTLEIKLLIRESWPLLGEISLLLPTLSMLRGIRLAYIGHENLDFSWRIPENFRLAFVQCLRLPSLTDVCIENLPFPLSTFNHCKHLKSLSLRRWRHVEGDKPQLPTIDFLTLHLCHSFSLSRIVNSVQPLHISSLKFFSAEYGQRLEVFRRILVSCSQSLTSLDIDICKNYTSCYNFKTSNVRHCENSIPIPLSGLPHLQQLTIRARLGRQSIWEFGSSDSWAYFSAIPAITKVLQPVSSLRHLTLDFHIHVDADTRPHMTEVLCSPICSLLIQSAQSIGSIDLRINSIKGSDSPAAILEVFTEHPDLMEFVENGDLTLTPVVADVL